MPVSADGYYDRRAWNEEPDQWSYLGPFGSNEERLIQQSLSAAFMTGQEIQDNVRAPLPQVEVFRPRFGYPVVQERQATVVDIVGVDRRVMSPASTWFSGGPAGYTGSPQYSANSLGLA